MSNLQITVDEKTLKGLVRDHLADILGDINLSSDDVAIETKSKQNYRSEWEVAAFRATVKKDVKV